MAKPVEPEERKAPAARRPTAKRATKPLKAAQTVAEPVVAARPFPIVVIGASAGGLEALKQFLVQVPANSGMAFVVIQHLDRNYNGMMPELPLRVTSMPVMQARNRI